MFSAAIDSVLKVLTFAQALKGSGVGGENRARS